MNGTQTEGLAVKALRERWFWPGVGMALVVLLVAFCRPKATPLPAKEQKSLDSSLVTAPLFHTQQAALVLRETTFVRVAIKAKASADTLSAKVDTLRKTADSLAVLAGVAADTAGIWKATAIARGETITALTKQRDSLSSYGDAEHSARIIADSLHDNAERRVTSLADLNARIAKDLAKGDRCRVAWVLSCPSRKVIAVGGLVVGGLLANDKTRHALLGVLP